MVTFLIATVLAVLFGLAIRYLVKHGTCDCGSKGVAVEAVAIARTAAIP